MDTSISKVLMKEKITSHLRRLIKNGSSAIEKQFSRAGVSEKVEIFENEDPLGEESLYSPTKGLVHKFSNRALIKVSYRCAAHCLFCTRDRQIGDPSGDLTETDINNCISYICSHTEIDDVILSGGDPFVTPKVTLNLLLSLSKIKSVKVIRIGTRLPIHSPRCFNSKPILKLVKGISRVSDIKPVYLLVHVNHPDELVPETRKVLTYLNRNCAILVSQSVFLKGINDSSEILGRLFIELYHLGISPYYIYRCDSVQGLERFVCSFKKEKQIMTELRRILSGLALPTHVVDVYGRGKIPVPTEFWRGSDECIDYDEKIIRI
ncbi:MAG: 4Fe-4S cluster-binding domain-containing protein [bacterium]